MTSESVIPEGTEGSLYSGVQKALDDLIERVMALRGAPSNHSDRLHVLVSDRWLATTALPWSAALARDQTADAYARSQLNAAGFELELDDQVRVEDAPFRELRIAISYPAPLMSALRDVALRLGALLYSVLPMSVMAASAARRLINGRVLALMVLEGDTLSVYKGIRGRFILSGIGVALAVGTDEATEVVKLWHRHKLRDPSLATVPVVPVLDLRNRSKPLVFSAATGLHLVRLPQMNSDSQMGPVMHLAARFWLAGDPLDAVQRRGSLSTIGVIMLTTMSCVALAAVYQASSITLQRAALEKAVTASIPAPPAPRKPTRTRDEQARLEIVNAAIAELNLPIGKLLRAVRPPKDLRVGITGIEILPRAASGMQTGALAVLKINAEAASGSEMARYVAFLSERPPFMSAYLVNHEVVEAQATKPYRFAVEALWRN